MYITEGDDYLFEGKINYIEALGEVTLIYFNNPDAEHGEPIIVKLAGIQEFTRGQTIRLNADADKLHLFNENDISCKHL